MVIGKCVLLGENLTPQLFQIDIFNGDSLGIKT